MTRLPKIFVAAVLTAVLVTAATPWPVARSGIAEALDRALSGAPGLSAWVGGAVTFKLLPRPRVQAAQLSIVSSDGSVLVDAPSLKAEIDIGALMRGVWRVSSVTLVEPTVTIDADRMAAWPPVRSSPRSIGPLQVNLRAGVVRVRSSNAMADLLATGVDASTLWPAERDALAISGTATLRGTNVQFAAKLDRPGEFRTAGGSAASLQVDSPLFNLAATGLLSGDPQEQFVGRVSLGTPALAHLMKVTATAPAWVGVRRAQIGGDVVARAHDLSLSNAQLRLDRARFEGTLAWRQEAGRSLVAGTLATDLLDLGDLFGDGAGRGSFRAFYREPLDRASLPTDIDLRISASTARVGRLSFDDTAVSALLRDGRLELTLDEANAYGGVVKARAIASLSPNGIDGHAEASARNVDLGALAERLDRRDGPGGVLSGQAVLDGHGRSLGDLVGALSGQGDVTVEDGRLADVSLLSAFRRLGRASPLSAQRPVAPTVFDRAQWQLDIRNGVVSIPDGKLTAPGVALSFGAATGLNDGWIQIHAVAAQADATGMPVPGGRRLPIDLGGFWDGPLVSVSRGALRSLALPLPDLSAPLR